MLEVISGCRSCGRADLETMLAFGDLPLADAFAGPEELGGPDPVYPLTVAVCASCALVQLRETVSPETLFDESYRYYSSFSDALVEHSRANAQALIRSRGLGPESLVVEIASNDGYMLRHFVEQGVPVVGFEPAPGPASVAESLGIPTIRRFFGIDEGTRLARERRPADVVIANNVLAHVPDLNGFVAGIGAALGPDGVAVVEVPYVRDLLERREFDTIYHEHLCYFSVSALAPLFQRHGLSLNRVEHLSIHGGSLRLHVGRLERVDESVGRFLRAEKQGGLTETLPYLRFAAEVEETQRVLVDLLRELKDGGVRIAGYGAAAKGTTLLNACGIGRDLIDYVVDRNTFKQGRFIPGVRIPIRDPELLISDMPEYVLLLAWNFREEILAQQNEYVRRGGRFIQPIPRASVITGTGGRDDGMDATQPVGSSGGVERR